uniref:Caspase domain protein n=1 Tax=Megaviridae environmental sample TaxID=1737588 RepID=A0A5J6VJ37_9VIRU|nr:MAG: caspase domain protein [Megaviridae environmental sample]
MKAIFILVLFSVILATWKKRMQINEEKKSTDTLNSKNNTSASNIPNTSNTSTSNTSNTSTSNTSNTSTSNTSNTSASNASNTSTSNTSASNTSTSNTSTSNTHMGIFIGINYVNNPSMRLYGCVGDTVDVLVMAENLYGMNPDNVTLIIDDDTEFRRRYNGMYSSEDYICDKRPNISTLRKTLQLCVDESNKKNKFIFMQYAGHGHWKSGSSNEDDNRDECLVCTDGNLYDNEINEQYLSKLDSSTRLYAVIDCCHSGTMFDLPIMMWGSGDIKSKNSPKTTTACIVKISGCRDHQYSYENNGNGLLTRTVINTINANPNITWDELCKQTQNIFNTKYPQYKQNPVVTCNNKSYLNNKVVI